MWTTKRRTDPIVSHATALPSADSVMAVLQDYARRRMSEQRPKYDAVTSRFVIDEASLVT